MTPPHQVSPHQVLLQPVLPQPVLPQPVLKALGDETRYSIYELLVRSAHPLAISEICASIGLHPNTVRPHLERMRDVGLVEVATDCRESNGRESNGRESDVTVVRRRVGRPRHLYSLSVDAPTLDPATPVMPTLARMVLAIAARTGADGDDAEAVGRDEGRRRSLPYAATPSACDALVADLDRLGFEPSVAAAPGDGSVVTFGRCPFGDLAEQHPDLVCGLHRGLVDGFVSEFGDTELSEFHPLSDRAPCRATLR